MTGKKSVIIIISLVFVLGIIKIFFLKKENTNPSKGNSPNKKIPVLAYVVKSQNILNKIYVNGTILPSEEVDLSSEINGKIVKIYFDEGSKVNKGDLLVKLNDSELQVQKKKLEMQIKLYSEKEKRFRQLLDIKGVSQEEYDNALNELNSIKADVDLIQVQIEKTEIRAPFDGTIGLKNVSEGATVTPAITIASVQQTDPIKIDLNIPERNALQIHKGDTIYFYMEGNVERFVGKIYAIEPRIDPVTHTLPIRAICSNKDGKIIPGVFARVELILEEVANTYMIPTEAVIPDLRGSKVFISRNGKAVSAGIETGIRNDTTIQVINGLNAGDTIITTGIMMLRPGMSIQISGIKNN